MSSELSDNLIEHEDAVGRLLNVLQSGGPYGVELARKHLGRAPATDEERGRARTVSIADAEHVYAGQHGFEDWPALRLAVFRRSERDMNDPLTRAQAAIFGRDPERLADVLRTHPEECKAGNEATSPLLSIAIGAREVELVRMLLEAGADVHRADHCGCTPLHRAAYGHPPEPNPGLQDDHARILDLLLEAGARVDVSSHGDGGTPLAMAIFWGHNALAEKVAERSIEPLNLRTAAGLGRVDLIQRLIVASELLPQACAQRDFYRPHDGFPAWQPKLDAREILDEAFVYAAQCGRLETMEQLMDYGAVLDGRPYNGTALHRVAHKGPFDALRWLISHGVGLNSRWDTPAGSTPLHAAAVQGRLETVRFLVDYGADPTLEDEAFGTTPHGYAKWAGNHDVMDYLGSVTA